MSHYDQERQAEIEAKHQAELDAMSKAIPFEWEDIAESHQRAKVYGGWLVKAYESVEHFNAAFEGSNGCDWRIAMTFVPDPQHLWQVDNE